MFEVNLLGVKDDPNGVPKPIAVRKTFLFTKP